MHRAADTRHEYTTLSHYPDTGSTSSGLYPLNAEHLVRKKAVPILVPLVGTAGARTHNLLTVRRTLYPLGHTASKLR